LTSASAWASAEVAAAFRGAFAKGRFVNAAIRDRFACREPADE
jgi:hypothetical protein